MCNRVEKSTVSNCVFNTVSDCEEIKDGVLR